MKIIEKFINDIIHIRTSFDLNEEEILVEKDDFNKVINGLSYRVIDSKVIGLRKIASRLLISNSWLDADDITQETLKVIVEQFNKIIEKGEFTAEKLGYLFKLTEGNEEEAIESKRLYCLLKKVMETNNYSINNRRKKVAFEGINGTTVDCSNFTDIAENHRGSLENFDYNEAISMELYKHGIFSSILEEEKKNRLFDWVQDNKYCLTQNQLDVLLHPEKFDVKKRSYYLKAIAKKFEKQMISIYGTDNFKIIKVKDDIALLNIVLDAENFQRELIANLDEDLIVRIIYSAGLDSDTLQELSRAYNDEEYIIMDKHLIKISSLLWNEIETLEKSLNDKISKDTTKVEKILARKENFNIKLVPAINLEDGIYKKRDRELKRATNEYRTFKKIIEHCYKDGTHTINPKWLNFQEFAGWYHENRLDIDEDQFIYHLDGKHYSEGNCVFIPLGIRNFLKTKQGISYDKGVKKYVAYGAYKGKNMYIAQGEKEEEVYEKYIKWKQEKLVSLAEDYKEIISSKLYKHLIEEFKF